MKKRICFILLMLLISGCSSLGLGQSQDKREWMAADCSGFKGWEGCKQQAMKSCKNGYDVANQEENPVTQKRSMLYSCK